MQISSCYKMKLVSIFKRCITTFTSVPHVCIIGSGPAGFYASQQILKSHSKVNVDVYEKLPVPFGLVRYGVAPDHPEVKNCINTFNSVANNNRFNFFGNVAIGSDVTLAELKEAYHSVILAYGSAKDKTLGIVGEDLPGVHSARRFVGWYNGLPEDTDIDVNLNVEDVAIIGHGNVALDVARILLTPFDLLKKTDIPDVVLKTLYKSKVKRVTLIGRRGPEHVSFTIKEFREMLNLPQCRYNLNPLDFQHLQDIIPKVPRQKKRLMELLYKTGSTPYEQSESSAKAEREWSLKFFRSPKKIISQCNDLGIKGILLLKNRLEGETLSEQAVSTDEVEEIKYDIVFRSIGYQGIKIDKDIPFDEKLSIVPNINGCVTGHPGMYVCGWIGTGPIGVILSTMTNSFAVGKRVVADLNMSNIDPNKCGREAILNLLSKRGVLPVTFDDWTNLDKYEVNEGLKRGKPREKVTDIEEMLKLSQKDV